MRWLLRGGPVRLVRVFCPECDGASADYRLPPCDYCLNNGHFDVDREKDGSVPTTHKNGTPVRLYVDNTLPEIRSNPLRLTY